MPAPGFRAAANRKGVVPRLLLEGRVVVALESSAWARRARCPPGGASSLLVAVSAAAPMSGGFATKVHPFPTTYWRFGAH
jgi:zona occludens toxin (predicted ATPase)